MVERTQLLSYAVFGSALLLVVAVVALTVTASLGGLGGLLGDANGPTPPPTTPTSNTPTGTATTPTGTANGTAGVGQASVEIHNQTINHENQPRLATLTVKRAELPHGGFIVLFARGDNGTRTTLIDNSSYLSAGNHTNISITPARLIRTEQRVEARLHKDQNDNRQWDGIRTDPQYPRTDEAVVSVRFTTTVDVVLTNATKGLQQYRVTLHTPADRRALITNITPHQIVGDGFNIVRGGTGTNIVSVQGVDLNDEVSQFNGTKRLVTVQFRDGSQLERSEVNLLVGSLRNDNGSAIPTTNVSRTNVSRTNVSTRIKCYTPFDEPIPEPPKYGPPTDPDCDGLFEDVNGDGRLTEDDTQALAFVEPEQLTDEQVAALDFNDDGTIDFADVRRLREEIKRQQQQG